MNASNNKEFLRKCQASLMQYLSRGSIGEAVGITQKALGAGIAPREKIAEFMGQTAAALYDNFFVSQVEQYYSAVLPAISADAANAMKNALEKPIALTGQWTKRIADLSVERSAREVQESVRAKDYEGALKKCHELIGKGENEDQKKRMCVLLGNIFGTLENLQDRVEKLKERLGEELSPEYMEIIQANRKERLALIYKSELNHRNVEWSRNLSSAITEMKTYLPLSTKASNPEKEDIEKFNLLVRSILRCYYLPPYKKRIHDIILLLIEFCPKEVSVAGAASGVESRLYNSLTPTQKKTVIEVLTELGKNKTLMQEIIKFARANQGNRFLQYAVEILGAFKAESAAPCLIELLQDKSLSTIHPNVIISMGSLYSEEIREVLIELLASKITARTITPQKRDEITNILLALAKISRNKNIPASERNSLIGDVIRILGKHDARINLVCAENFFLVRREDILPHLRSWAARILVQGLWLKDTAPKFAKGPKSGEASHHTLLGKREKLVDLLARLGSDFLQDIIQTGEKHMIHYGSAYMAMGELMARMGDERASPLLGKLLAITMGMDEASLGKYETEYYWDAARETRQVLDKDKIAHSLIFALNKIKGKEANRILEDVYHKVQTEQYILPGKQTSDLLFKAHARIEEERGSPLYPDRTRHSSPEISRGELKDAVKILRKKYRFRNPEKTRFKKISALRILGKAKSVDALDSILELLDDKDPMISAAALSVLIDYNVPLLSAEKLGPFLEKLAKTWKAGSVELKRKIEKVLKSLHPEREGVQDRIRNVIEKEPDTKLRLLLQRLFVLYLAPRQGDDEEASIEQGKEKGTRNHYKYFPGKISELEKKRLFLEARKKWVDRGKKGDPPKLEDF